MGFKPNPRKQTAQITRLHCHASSLERIDSHVSHHASIGHNIVTQPPRHRRKTKTVSGFAGTHGSTAFTTIFPRDMYSKEELHRVCPEISSQTTGKTPLATHDSPISDLVTAWNLRRISSIWTSRDLLRKKGFQRDKRNRSHLIRNSTDVNPIEPPRLMNDRNREKPLWKAGEEDVEKSPLPGVKNRRRVLREPPLPGVWSPNRRDAHRKNPEMRNKKDGETSPFERFEKDKKGII